MLNSICTNLSPTKCLSENGIWENIKSGCLCGCVQCDIEVPENLRETFANFPPIFRTIDVGRDDIGPLRKIYANILLSQYIPIMYWDKILSQYMDGPSFPHLIVSFVLLLSYCNQEAPFLYIFRVRKMYNINITKLTSILAILNVLWASGPLSQ